jgi:CheY-like chemotaxis protein
MKRVLFVDDEPRVLEQLQQMLESQNHHWDMAFAPGGEAALMLLDATPFDVVVSDIAMPGMDGAALMKIVCERYPATVRIVLSAPQEMEEALRAVPVAHQFLLKPCDPNMLRVAVERATSLSNILSNKLLANLVGSVKDLPVLPRTYQPLRQKLAEPEASIRDVVHIVEQDVAISAKILQLVNSAFFGLPREVSSVRTAVGFLGIAMLRTWCFRRECSPSSTSWRGCRVFLAKSCRRIHSSPRKLPDRSPHRRTYVALPWSPACCMTSAN